MCVCVCVCACPHACTHLLSSVQLFVTGWTVPHKAPLSMEFSRQEYWSELPFPTPGDLSNPRKQFSCVSCIGRGFLPLSTEIVNCFLVKVKSFPMVQTVKCPPAIREIQVRSLGQEDPLEKEIATHFSILAWKVPRMEEPGGLQSMESQRVGHN